VIWSTVLMQESSLASSIMTMISRSVDGPKVTAHSFRVVTNTLIFSISEDWIWFVYVCSITFSYPESLPSLSCNKSASIDSTRTYVSEFRRKLTFHRFHDPVFRLHQVVVLMENDSDALTSDKLRHKACAVPTKLDINNTQV
jgi:hypothetical protein